MIPLRSRMLAAAVLSIAVALPVAGQASAGPDDTPGTAGAATLTGTPEPPRPAFYEPPAKIPSTPGTIIRSEPAPLLLDPLGLSSSVVTATRVMYSSTDRYGTPIAVTGTVFVPKTPYVGTSKRPQITYAAGTQGMGDRCAPSRQMSDLVEYEGIGLARSIGRGYAVGMTDYQGLGTPGTHTYMDRKAQGAAVLDMARAVQNLEGSGITDANPVGIMGYSQGGGAAAAAAEMAGTYAPDLQLKGSAVGAPPADLTATVENAEGGLLGAAVLYGLLGQAQSARIDLDPYLSAEGRDMAADIEDHCFLELADYAFQDSSRYLSGGTTVTELLATEPFKSAVAQQRIGRTRPSAPVVINHSVGDEVVPYAVGKQLGSDWCDKGANVTFNAGLTPTHVGGYVPHIEKSMLFFEQRFAGATPPSTCWAL